MMFTLAQTLRHGVAGGIAAALGIVAGCVVHTLVAAFGLAALLAASAHRVRARQWAGAAYLVVAGDRHAARRRVGERAGGDAAVGSAAMARRRRRARRARAWRGSSARAFSPTSSIRRSRSSSSPCCRSSSTPTRPTSSLAFLFLGAWFVVQGALFLVAFVLLVAPLRRWRASPAWRRGLNAAGAGIFVWLAARLALVERT